MEQGEKAQGSTTSLTTARKERPMNDYLAALVERTMEASADMLVSRSYRDRQQLLVDLANMLGESGIDWFSRKWGAKLWPEMPRALNELSDDLRRIWRLSDAERLNFSTWRVEDAESHYPPELQANEILNKWLSWRPSAAQTRALKAAQSQKEQKDQEATPEAQLSALIAEVQDESAYDSSQWMLPNGYVPFSCWLPTRTLLPDTRGLRPMLIQGVFEHWGHFKYCANLNCVTPYFIGTRKDQIVCDAEICKAERQREHARKWWNENRARKSQQDAAMELTKKGRNDHVTRKTR
jgi:hypothetical protein